MSGHAGAGLHYHGYGAERRGHSHYFLHINHEHVGPEEMDPDVEVANEHVEPECMDCRKSHIDCRCSGGE